MDPDSNSIILQLVILLILIGVNAFFAMSEIAIVTFNDNKLKKLAEDGNKRAATLYKMVQQPSKFLSTIQIGVTMAGFLAAGSAAEQFAEPVAQLMSPVIPYSVAEPIALFVITLILGYFNLVLGELVPKRIAMHNPEKVSLAVAPIVRFVFTIAKPLVALLSVSTNAILKLIHISPEDQPEQVTEEEIRMMVDVGNEEGSIEKDEADMIDNIFEFDDITVEDVMTPPAPTSPLWKTPPPSWTSSAWQSTKATPASRSTGKISTTLSALFTPRICCAASMRPRTKCPSSPSPPSSVPLSLSRNPTAAPTCSRPSRRKRPRWPSSSTSTAAPPALSPWRTCWSRSSATWRTNMTRRKRNTRRSPIISLSWTGSMSIEDVEELLGCNIGPEEDYDTLSGLITDKLDRIPAKDEHPVVRINNVEFTVLDTEERRIAKLRADILPEEPKPEEPDEE